MTTDQAKSSSSDSNVALWHETATQVVDLLTHYSFDLGGNQARQLIDRWQSTYSPNWIRWAVIEALYQGRYKAISVEQILQLWQRRQQPRYHFNYEFERLVCNKFPRTLSEYSKQKSAPDTTILPDLPAPSRTASPAPKVVTESSIAEPPPWAELAEQIQQEEPAEPVNAIVLRGEAIAPLKVDHLEAPEILLNRVAKLQAGVEALIEQATSSLNASNEAMKIKLHPEETKNESENSEEPSLDLSEEVHPPIHQFMPMPTESEFHSKLKAVVEQETTIDS
ncbi:hypothetical protein ACQ4M3_03565 [Leptolyngbya sp. AN03gr2]|uniref:hypothetical protein n=1 Tax=unclassified Leptolyngbya TaxID=2650499 RepID=UPI003D312C1F